MCGKQEAGIPGFGSSRVRAERSQLYERASIMQGRRALDPDFDDGLGESRSPQAGLDGAFADVEKLEASLRQQSATK